jgi:hypothetical protein
MKKGEVITMRKQSGHLTGGLGLPGLGWSKRGQA